MMDPNHFLMIVLSRFELFHIFTSADVRKRYREANKVGTDTDRCQKEIQTPAGSVLTPLTVLTTTACVCVCVDRMWSSRTIHSLRRCFILSSWSLVRKCVVMLVWTSVCPAARSHLCLCVHVQVSVTSQVWDRWRRLTRSEEKSSTSCRSDQWLTANSSRLYLRM